MSLSKPATPKTLDHTADPRIGLYHPNQMIQTIRNEELINHPNTPRDMPLVASKPEREDRRMKRRGLNCVTIPITTANKGVLWTGNARLMGWATYSAVGEAGGLGYLCNGSQDKFDVIGFFNTVVGTGTNPAALTQWFGEPGIYVTSIFTKIHLMQSDGQAQLTLFLDENT